MVTMKNPIPPKSRALLPLCLASFSAFHEPRGWGISLKVAGLIATEYELWRTWFDSERPKGINEIINTTGLWKESYILKSSICKKC